MGLIDRAMNVLFGSRNIVAETAEVFRENAEKRAERAFDLSSEALNQFAAEFADRDRGGFDRFMDGVNRVPRPAMALGTLGLFTAAMVDPVWFTARMNGLSYVPEPLWWLLGAIVGFYFGARHQAKGQEFRRKMVVVEAVAKATPVVVTDTTEPAAPPKGRPDQPGGRLSSHRTGENAALDDWRANGQ